MKIKIAKLSPFLKLSLIFSLAGFSFFISPHIINVDAASTGNLLGFEQTFNRNDGTTTTNLVSFDQITGATTPVGQPLEDTLSNNPDVNQSNPSIDTQNHHLFYTDARHSVIVIQDTQTGTILAQLPLDNNFVYNAGLTYEPSTGRLLGFEQTFNRNDGTTTTNLVSFDQTTGIPTTIGAPLETTLSGRPDVNQSNPSLDDQNHRLFYTDASNGLIIIQDTQTGAILNQLPLDQNTFAFNAGLTYESSTGILLGFKQTIDRSTGNSTTTLVSFDQTTGATTIIGTPLEATLPGRPDVNQSNPSIDAQNHRLFYTDASNSLIIIQDTQTGAILAQLPLDQNIFAFNAGLTYEPSTTNNAPVINSLANTTIQKGDTYIANGSFSDSDSTSWTASVDYGSGFQLLSLNGMNFTLSHVYNSLGTYTVTVNVTDNQGATGNGSALITVIPVNGLAGANLSHTNYTSADFANQNLSHANMSVAIFNNVDFTNANLSQVTGSNSSFQNDNFTGANLNKVNFSNSNLTGSNFTNAVITQGNLSNANLTNANFAGANLAGANLSGATITGVFWLNTTCPDGTNSNNNNNTCAGHF